MLKSPTSVVNPSEAFLRSFALATCYKQEDDSYFPQMEAADDGSKSWYSDENKDLLL